METKTVDTTSIAHLLYLPRFASFLLKERLEAFVSIQLRYSYEVELPLLKFFQAMPEEERMALSRQTSSEFLGYLAANRASEQIETSMQQWMTNRLPVVDKDNVETEDILLVNHVRKKAMLDLLPDYTKDPFELIELIKEIDLFTLQAISTATRHYMQLYKQRLEENSHFIQKVAETIPGAVYVFDAEAYKGIYSNNKLPDIIGYAQTDLNALGENAIATLVHPDDQALLKKQLEAIRASVSDEPMLIKYRIRKKDGGYKWLANYESVFKRTESGAVWQTIGITLDVDKEQKATEELEEREQQLLEAQDIAQLGNYYWDFAGKASTASAKTFELLELEPLNFSGFMENVHPNDKDKLTSAIEASLLSGEFICEYRIIGASGTRNIWNRGLVQYANGKALGMSGTVMDVTEHNRLLQKLAKADGRHKQAEALAHIGTYTWNVNDDEVEWSEEMFRLYETAVDEKPSYAIMLQHIHHDDRQLFDDTLRQSIANKTPYDFYFRLVNKNGGIKILHSRGDVETAGNGEAVRIVGTDQDVTEKQNLIRRLQKSESRYRQAEEIADMGNWSWDVRSKRLEWTDHLYRIYGLPPQSEEITIERFLAFVHPADREAVTQGVDKLNTEDVLDYTFRIVTDDGTEKWLRSIAQVVRNAEGAAVYIVGTEQNVSEREALINRLKESEQLYKQAQSLAHMGNWTYDLRTQKITWSDELYAIYEQVPGEPMTMQEWSSRLKPGEEERLLAEMQEAIEQKKPLDSTHSIILPAGKKKVLHRRGEVVYDSAGRAIKLVGTTQDVTEQKEAVETIRDQEYFIQQIADASPTILYLFDVTTQSIAYVNREAFFVLGYLPEEIVEEGSRVTMLLYHPDDIPLLPGRKQSPKNFQQVDSMIQYECRMKHKDGDYRWLLVREIVFKSNDNGTITQIIGAALDISRRKDMEKTILQNAHQLEQSNASLEEFAYVASHDLKEPLRKISTFGDRLVASQADRLSDDGKIYLTKIVDASQRMQNMISDLLAISMISGNKGFEKTSLQKILEETLQTLEYKIEQQKAVIRYEVLPEASVVASQFRQLFQNLIANSLKFVREDVQPVISVDCKMMTPDETAAYQLRKAPAYLQLRFTDNGIGFEKEYAQKIFAIFHRLHGRSEYEGSGIGLAICKKIAEHHGGVIFAGGELEKGASFTIIIPA